jgi:hypothetical protein
MVQGKRQAALAKVKRTLEATSGSTSLVPPPEIHPQSPAQSAPSPKTALTPEQKTMIEAKRQAALAKVKCAMGGGAAETASAGQLLEILPQSPRPSSPSLSPQKTPLIREQKTMIESKRNYTQEGDAGVTDVSQTSERSKTTSLPPQESVSVSTGLIATAACNNPHNEPLFQAGVELSRFYSAEGNYNAVATYHKVSQAIRDLTEAVTEDNAFGLGKGQTKVPNIGKA